MAIRFFNSLTETKEVFEPAEPDRVRIYSCGPTVYNYNHLGNFRAYVFVDLLRRFLRLRGFGLDHSVNITDVEDKIIENAHRAGLSIEEFTAPYIEAFLEDLRYLKLEEVEHRPRATRSIPAMIELMGRLHQNGHAYQSQGNVYFRLASDPGYGRLSHIEPAALRQAADGRFEADEYSKEDVRDFALWKAPATDYEQRWESPWGPGRPGWHLECSAMIRQIYGAAGVDIHTGGVDLMFPHHENEIAQSCCAYPDDRFVGVWLHNEHLLVEGKKMSKSLGNYFMLRDFTEPERARAIVDQGRAPALILDLLASDRMAGALRYLLIGTHYRQKLNFTFDGLQGAANAIERLQGTIDRLLRIATETAPLEGQGPAPSFVEGAIEEFTAALDDDLNISKALAAVFELNRTLNQALDRNDLGADGVHSGIEAFRMVNQILDVFSFELREVNSDPEHDAIDALVAERNQARANRDFARADEIRNLLRQKGVTLEDTATETLWRRD